MSIYITQQQRTSDPISVNFPEPFEQAPAVLVTPFWQGEGKPVPSIETVLNVSNAPLLSGRLVRNREHWQEMGLD
jgi:hypothetical protein